MKKTVHSESEKVKAVHQLESGVDASVKAKTSALTGSLARYIASYWEWPIKNLSDIITLYT